MGAGGSGNEVDLQVFAPRWLVMLVENAKVETV